MKICILLTGLQRNFEPFIDNQINCVINKYNLDVFIYTSDEIAYRYHKNDGTVDYCNKEKSENTIDFFKDKYKNLKDIYIDYGNSKFNEFISNIKIKKSKNHTINMINSYFKFNEAIKLMKLYEDSNNFKYDMVLRCRLDFFAFNDFLDLNKVDKRIIYLPFVKHLNYKDDSGILMNRECIEYVEDFINIIINFNDNDKYIIIENEFHNYLGKKYKLYFTEHFCYRIGTIPDVSVIPYYNTLSKNKLFSLEYKF